jgi:hypothetical protein
MPAQWAALLAWPGHEGYAMRVLYMPKCAVVAKTETQIGVTVPCKQDPFHCRFHQQCEQNHMCK